MIDDDATESIKAWNYKYLVLGNKITELENNQDKIVKLLAYLLLTQLLEFELRRFIPDIDSHIGRKKQQLFDDIKGCTLGQLCTIIREYNLNWLSKLSTTLDEIVTVRNELQHHMFDEGYTLSEIQDKAIEDTPKVKHAMGIMDDIIDDFIGISYGNL